MRIVAKQSIPLEVWEAGSAVPRRAEIRAAAVEDGWEARLLWEGTLLPRRFRSTSLAAAVGKMWTWVRWKFPRVRPLAVARRRRDAGPQDPGMGK